MRRNLIPEIRRTTTHALGRIYRSIFPLHTRRSLWFRRFFLLPLRLNFFGPSLQLFHSINLPTTLRETSNSPSEKSRILFVLHDSPGGVWQTSLDLISALAPRYDCFVLMADPHRISLFKSDPLGRLLIRQKTWWLNRPWSLHRLRSQEHRDIYDEVLSKFQPDIIHVRHLLGHTLDLPDLCAETDTLLVLSLHDYFCICPSIYLVNEAGAFCASSCVQTSCECAISFPWLADISPLNTTWLDNWRTQMKFLFSKTSAFFTTSQATRRVFTEAYPELDHQSFSVIEHGRDFAGQQQQASLPKPGEPLRIAIPGHLRVHKGSKFIRSLWKIDQQQGNHLEFHFFGTVDHHLRNVGASHGPYDREDLPRLLADLKPSFVGVFSLWPETYCHVLNEAWSVGVPVLVSDLGAPKERVERHGGGWTLPADDPAKAYTMILEIRDDPRAYHRQQERATIRDLPSTADMAKEYEQIYRSLAEHR